MERATKHILHALNLILQHIGVALRITIGWFVVILLTVVAMAGTINGLLPTLQSGDNKSIELLVQEHAPLLFLLMMVIMIAFSCCAVAWHRYILMDEKPRGLLVLPPMGLAFGYIWRSIVIAFLVMIPLALISSLSRLIAVAFSGQEGNAPNSVTLFFAAFFVSLVGQYIFTLLCISLPATAIGKGKEHSIFEVAKASRDDGGLVFWVSFITVTVVSIFDLVTGFFVPPAADGVAASTPNWITALKVIFYWFYFMFGIGILSTLYGSLVERREI